jgi:hypothetical protein
MTSVTEHIVSDEGALKQRILADLGVHIRTYGRTEWDRVRENPAYAHVIGKAAGEAGRRKFWRWVKAVSEPAPADKTRPHEAREVAEEGLAQATRQAREAEKHLPAAPSPAYIMRSGAKAAKNIDFLASLNQIWADAEWMREQALAGDPEGPEGQRIDDMKTFDASIRRRLEVMDSALKAMREIWDLDFQKRYYDGIKDIIVSELAPYPEVQARVIRRLADLNKSRGMTMYAEAR